MELKTVLLGIALDLEEAIRQKLIDEDIRHTSKGITSVKVTIEDDELVIRMNDYLEFIEYGMPNPTSPEELEKWVSDKVLKNWKPKKSIKGKSAAERRRAAVKSISENMAKHITRFGPRPRPFLRPVIHQQLQGIIDRNVSAFS